ncbi:MAG: tetratricopeptide repeat protein [Anaerolineae bacterium]|nr:tetratricopeptide repeat protein [Anaerolineae bacterium]
MGLGLFLIGVICWQREALLAEVWTNAGGIALSRALLAHDEDSLEKAKTLLYRAQQVYPRGVATSRLLVRTAVAMGEDPVIWEPLSGKDALALFFLGMAYYERGEETRALSLWKKVSGSAWYFMYKGNRAYEKGDWLGARKSYTLSLAIDPFPSPGREQMYQNLCRAEVSQRHWAAAEHWCSLALRLRRNEWNLVWLGRIYLQQGKSAEALLLLKEALKRNNRIPSGYYYLGLALQRLGRTGEALSALEQGLEFFPDHPYLNFAAGDLYLQQGQIDRAYCCYWKAARYGGRRLQNKAQEKLLRLGMKRAPLCY